MPEPSPQPSTGVEASAEAKAAAAARCALWSNHWRDPENGPFDGDEKDYLLGMADRMLTAAYKIDTPAIHAAGVAEGRAAMRDVLQAARKALMPFAGCDTQDDHAPRRDDEWPPMRERIKDWFSWDDFRAAVEALDAIEAAFPTTGEKTDG